MSGFSNAVCTTTKREADSCGMLMLVSLFSCSHNLVQFALSHGQTQVLTGCHHSTVGISLEEGKLPLRVYILYNYMQALSTVLSKYMSHNSWPSNSNNTVYSPHVQCSFTYMDT